MERSCEPMNNNRIEGVAEQGERARNREALVIMGQAAWIRRLCSEGVHSYLGISRLMPGRAMVLHSMQINTATKCFSRLQSDLAVQ